TSYHQALAAVEQTLDRVRQCSDDEKARLRAELAGLKQMLDKLTSGRVEIVVFGEISTGKSALINALVGRDVASVDVRGGWTREVWHVAWDGTGYTLPGLGESQVVLVDTPGMNKVDLYSRKQRERLLAVIRNERLAEIVPPGHVVTAAADPREREYVIQAA